MRKIIRERILSRFNNRCCKCSATERLEIDHIIPISRGGREDEINMQILCKNCNLKKGKSIDINKYFHKGDGRDYIFIDRSIIEIMGGLSSDEFKSIIDQKFIELCSDYEE